MKNTSLACIFCLGVMSALLLSPAYASAKFGGGGFSGPGPSLVTVKEALVMEDDARVSLRGNIVQHLGDDKYVFRDASGTVRVEIDDTIWLGQTVEPKDTVEILGKVDKDLNTVEIDVKRIVKQ